MLNRIAVSLWKDEILVPATLDAEGTIARLSSKSRDAWVSENRPWIKEVEEAAKEAEDAAIADQWKAFYAEDAEGNVNSVLAAMQEQMQKISGVC